MKQAWRTFWHARNSRERAVLTIGSMFLSLALLYGMAWLPISEGRKKLTVSLPQLRADAAQMHTDLQQIAGLQGNTGAASGDARRAVESGLQVAGLRDKVSAVDRVDNQRVRLTLNGVGFDGLLGFLETMQSQQRLRVESLQLQAAESGRVKGSVTLVGPAVSP